MVFRVIIALLLVLIIGQITVIRRELVKEAVAPIPTSSIVTSLPDKETLSAEISRDQEKAPVLLQEILGSSTSGVLELKAGDGIQVDGLTISNIDRGSLQSMFKAIGIDDENFIATSNDDKLSFAAGEGIDFAIDKENKKITINQLRIASAPAISTINLSSNIQGILPLSFGGTGASTAAQSRDNLGLVIGSTIQAFDSELLAISGLSSSANKLPYFTGAGTAALTDFTVFGRSLLDDADAATTRTTLGLASGGSGDIWVKKTGDTMIGDLRISSAAAAIRTGINQTLSLIPGGTGYTLVGDAAKTDHTLNTNDDFMVSGRLEVDKTAFFDADARFAGSVTTIGQYNTQGISPNQDSAVTIGGSTKKFSEIYVNTVRTNKVQPILYGTSLILTSLGPSFVRVGATGNTSRNLNSGDDLFVSGRLEVDGRAYLDRGLDTTDVQTASISAQKYVVSTPNLSSASFGQATIPVGSRSARITTTAVSSNSGIFTTAESPITSPLFISEKRTGVSFTVEMLNAAASPIRFNWWVVN